MCTLVLYFQVFPQYPLVIAANRDESLARPSVPPLQLSSSPWIYGGQDLFAGGTWLGINEYGVVAAILNRRALGSLNPRCRSRGLLCLDALKHPTATSSFQSITAQPAAQYNPFSLVIADQSALYLVYHPHLEQVRHLTPGVYMITNLDLNDPECPRIARFAPRFLQLSQHHSPSLPSLPDLFAQLHILLAEHEEKSEGVQDPRTGLCLHLDGYGTCSSTLLAYSKSEARYIYYFAPGPPCRTAYQEVSVPPGAFASQPPSVQ